MKNYKVKAIMKFTDKEEDTKRIVDDEFFCTKERYEYLKSRGVITLVEIEKIISEEEVQAIANAIVEEANEQEKSIEEIVDEIVEESKTKTKKSKKKNSKK